MSKALLTSICLAATLLVVGPAWAQNQPPQVSVVTLQTVQNSDGSQSVITPKGDLARLPGPGVNGNTAQIYMGAQGGFWYTDRNGQTVNLSDAVKQLQARRASTQAAVQVPQYAPQPYYPQQQQQQEHQSTSSGNGAMAAVGTAAAAGLGAMAGAAMTNSYYNAPYGTPMHYGANGNPYYYNNGNEQPFQDLNQNQKMALYNHNQVNQQNQQAAVQQTQTNQTNRQSSMQSNQSNRQTAYGNGGQQDYQKQQQWYQNQRKQNPQQFQRSDNNPFVSQSAGQAGAGNRQAAQSRDGDRAGRFGGGERSGGLRGELGGLRGGGGRRRF
ncbi:hypothetical protein BH11CYA1_BH11CYA1_32320 [soil metagenome]